MVEALDKSIELPQRDMEGPFLMPIDNLVSVPGRGTVAIGKFHSISQWMIAQMVERLLCTRRTQVQIPAPAPYEITL